jgi:membrane fusion protein, multidrug efflux system
MNKLAMLLILFSSLLFLSCQKEETTSFKNMEKVYEEQGIPVKVRTVGIQDFSTYLTFTSSLKGIKESTGSSLLSDTVEEILVEVGDYVEKDQVIIRFPKNNPAVNYYQAEAGFKAAEQAFRRIENLYKSNGVSRQSYDDVKTQYDVQMANWETVNDMIDVKAPISGYITRINVQTSENVHPGDGLFTVSNFDTLTSVAWVADHEIRLIKKGQRASCEWEGLTLIGEVTQVDLAKDMNKKAFAVHVQFSNGEHAVPSGVTADINIETSLSQDSIVVHRKEMLNNQNAWYVYVNNDGFAKQKFVEPGLRQGMYYQISEGLEAEEIIITEGLSLIRNNSRLQVIEDASAPLAIAP